MTNLSRITANSCPAGAASDARRKLAEAVGGRDMMDEPRRRTVSALPEALPICGPRGGVRRPTFVGNSFADEVVDDADAEDTMLAAIHARRVAERLGITGEPTPEQYEAILASLE